MKLRLAMCALALLLWAAPAVGQGCAMCYSTARAATEGGQRAISRGVLIMLIPPISFMTVGMGLAFRYGKKRDQEEQQPTDSGDD
jgi:hypothetical protein